MSCLVCNAAVENPDYPFCFRHIPRYGDRIVLAGGKTVLYYGTVRLSDVIRDRIAGKSLVRWWLGTDVLTLSGYNMQTGIRTIVDAQVQSPGRIVLSARLFGEMIRKMPDDVIVFAADENLSVHLTCGDASFEILGLSADDYPELPEVDDQFSVTLEQRTLKAMINQTSFAVSTKPLTRAM